MLCNWGAAPMTCIFLCPYSSASFVLFLPRTLFLHSFLVCTHSCHADPFLPIGNTAASAGDREGCRQQGYCLESTASSDWSLCPPLLWGKSKRFLTTPGLSVYSRQCHGWLLKSCSFPHPDWSRTFQARPDGKTQPPNRNNQHLIGLEGCFVWGFVWFWWLLLLPERNINALGIKKLQTMK